MGRAVSAEKEVRNLFAIAQQCPFYNMEKQHCGAAVAGFSVDRQRKELCCSDDYDNCPSYLAYVLRRSRALRSDSDWLDVV